MRLKKILLFVIFALSNVFSIYELTSVQSLQQQGEQEYNFTHPARVQLTRPSTNDVESEVFGEIANDVAWKEIVKAWEMITSSSPFASFSSDNFVYVAPNSQSKVLGPCSPEFENAFWEEMTTRSSFPNLPTNEECFFLGIDKRTGFIMRFVGQTPLIALLRNPPAFKEGSEYIERVNSLIAKSSHLYLNHADVEGYSALMCAAEENLTQLSYALLLRGVDVSQRSTTGETALSLAMYNSDQKEHVIRNMIMYHILKGTLGNMLHRSSEFSSSLDSRTESLFMNFYANQTYRSYF